MLSPEKLKGKYNCQVRDNDNNFSSIILDFNIDFLHINKRSGD